MTTPHLKYLPVWSLPLRLCHWGLALAVMVGLATGWLMTWAPERAAGVLEIHYLAAALLTAALVARLGLLAAGRGSDRLRELLPNRHRLRQALAVLRSYLTLGKLPLPRWYAHNPLWAPLYLLLFVVLGIQILTGALLLEQITLIGTLRVRALHALGHELLLGFVLLHLAAVFFHDAKGAHQADLSAMVNGHRLFGIEPLSMETKGRAQVVPLDALLQTSKKR